MTNPLDLTGYTDDELLAQIRRRLAELLTRVGDDDRRRLVPGDLDSLDGLQLVSAHEAVMALAEIPQPQRVATRRRPMASTLQELGQPGAPRGGLERGPELDPQGASEPAAPRHLGVELEKCCAAAAPNRNATIVLTHDEKNTT